MTKANPYLPHKVTLDTRADGVLLMESAYTCGPMVENTGVWLDHWARTTPEGIFIAEKSGADWRELSFSKTRALTRQIATGLLARGLQPGDRIAILSGNSIDHALLTLAAQYIGMVTVPIAEQYSLIPEARDRLTHIITVTKPALVYASDSGDYHAALNMPALANIPAVASTLGRDRPDITPFSGLLVRENPAKVDAAHANVGPDTLAKILFTSGSTSLPKGVCTTQRMMCVNQAQIGTVLEFLNEHPPKIVDWLPWNHVFGGSHNFNMMLAHGGSLYIDDGKPAPPVFPKTLQSLATHTGTLAFNVPVGWALMAKALGKDATLRKRFFENLDLLFYAAAPLPPDLWASLRKMADDELGRIPMMISSWGMTETAPAALIVHEPTETSGIIGVPLPGVTVKLVPLDGRRFEARVKGPNVMTAYYLDDTKTAAAFDDEGFLLTGDAVRFVNPETPEAGLAFDGRLSEDFKLMSGTWVKTMHMREQALGALGPLAQDVVITGEGRTEVGLLIFAAPGLKSPPDKSAITAALAPLLARATGSANRITRALVLDGPPSLRDHEVTAKGNLNVRRVLDGRAEMVTRLYDDQDPATILIH